MRAQANRDTSRNGGLSDFVWNIVGGALVSIMLAGVVYVLVGMVGEYLKGTEKFWELIYLKWYFIVILAIYLIMPTVLANTLGFLFGSKSSASGTKRKV